MTVATPRPYELANRFTATEGAAAMSGVQALVRAPLDAVRRDTARGLRSAGVVCGYRGSPLATVDLVFAAHREVLAAHDIRYVDGVNEELAATVLWGTQRALARPERTVDAAVGLWYGKGPGLDRAGDAIRHANLSGVPSTGGVVLAVGDDPECKSSTVPSSPDWTLADLCVPVLVPASVQEVLDLGRHGFELSRRSGSWVGLRIHTDVADGYATVELGHSLPEVEPFEVGGRPWTAQVDDRLFAPHSIALEEEAVGVRLDAVAAYVRAAGLDRLTGPGPGVARLGVLAAGKTYNDVVTALAGLGLPLAALEELGIRLYKPALVWPLERHGLQAFAAGLTELVVVEEKRGFLEDQVKALLYGTADAPVVVGKRDPDGRTLVPAGGVLDIGAIAAALARRLETRVPPERLRVPRARIAVVAAGDLPARTPYFCSGCPHNRSTEVPEGSEAGGGIGCHGMALFTRDRATGTTQMGGEGAQWVGESLLSRDAHRFQNMGDGTLAHSGFLAVRQAVAAGTTMTFKILANGAVAMTGGQEAAGGLPVPALTRQLEAEGVTRIEVVTDDVGRYGDSRFAPGVGVHDRSELDAVQRSLREVPGVTVLIYDQACAAELRRARKRGTAPRPTTRVVINEAVCDGCGDCGAISNCLSVRPVDTPLGRRTRIHQDSCNLDLSCIEGDCPAFLTVTVDPGRPRGGAGLPAPVPAGRIDDLEEPDRPRSAAVLIAGIGGTGVVTVAQVLATAAHLEQLEVSDVDQVGMAQKGGSVVSHLRIGPGALEGASRIEPGGASGYLVFDLLAGLADANVARLSTSTVAVVSTSAVPTGPMVSDVSQEHYPDRATLRARLDAVTDATANVYLDATAAARRWFGTEGATNLVIVGVAYQRRILPMSATAIERAIELNGVAVDANVAAFRLGRRLAAGDERELDDAAIGIEDAAPAAPPLLTPSARRLVELTDPGPALAEILAWRVPELIAYQDEAYARRYAEVIARVRAAEAAAGGGEERFAAVVARNLFAVMAYKDEYEVARLHRRSDLDADVTEAVGPWTDLRFHLRPPAASGLGLRRKIRFGRRRGRAAFWALERMRGLRRTRLDPFGRTAERRAERALVPEYIELVERLLPRLATEPEAAERIAALVASVRGFGDVKRRNLDRYHDDLAAALRALDGAGEPTDQEEDA